MRHTLLTRAGVVTVVGATVVLGFAGPAFAHVTVSRDTAPRGRDATVAIPVPNADHPAPILTLVAGDDAAAPAAGPASAAAAAPTAAAPTATVVAAQPAGSTSSKNGAALTVGIIGLVLGLAGAVLGLLAYRRTATH